MEGVEEGDILMGVDGVDILLGVWWVCWVWVRCIGQSFV